MRAVRRPLIPPAVFRTTLRPHRRPRRLPLKRLPASCTVRRPQYTPRDTLSEQRQTAKALVDLAPMRPAQRERFTVRQSHNVFVTIAGLEFAHMTKVDDDRAMNSEEALRGDSALDGGDRGSDQVRFPFGMDANIIRGGFNPVHLIVVNKLQLASGFYDHSVEVCEGVITRFVELHSSSIQPAFSETSLLSRAGKRCMQTVFINRLDQIIQRAQLKCADRMITCIRYEYHLRSFPGWQ